MNIAEILKYCPRDYRLYSPLFGEVTFYNITETKIRVYNLNKYCIYDFNHDGTFNVVNGVESTRECMLFPSKDQRDWSKFRFPTKPGDIMMMVDGSCPFITTNVFNKNAPICYCSIGSDGKLVVHHTWYNNFYIPASEEAKKKLFDKIAEAGYKWNADTLELEKIESKFKEGDVIVDKLDNLCLVSKIKNNNVIIVIAVLYTNDTLETYNSGVVERCSLEVTLTSTANRNRLLSALVRKGYKYDEKQHKLIKQEFKPFDKVLVRNNTDEDWTLSLFSHYSEKDKGYSFVCINGFYYNRYCIPYEGNEYLLGTTDSPT
jgi:hypothetical protein